MSQNGEIFPQFSGWKIMKPPPTVSHAPSSTKPNPTCKAEDTHNQCAGLEGIPGYRILTASFSPEKVTKTQ